MEGWTHQICQGCWWKLNGAQVPHRVSWPRLEHCCWCGKENRSGIYTRGDPKKLLCRGKCEW